MSDRPAQGKQSQDHMFEIAYCKRQSPPFAVDVVVLEEDTDLLLSAPNTVRQAEESTEVLLAEMAAAESLPLGSLVRRGRRVYAVVHDLTQTPTCRQEWVDAALQAIKRLCRVERMASMALEPLGCVHGKGSVDAFIVKVQQVFSNSEVRRIWIIEPGDR